MAGGRSTRHVLASIVAVVSAVACSGDPGAGEEGGDGGAGTTTVAAETPRVAEGDTMRLTYRPVHDPAAGDIWAYRFLEPEGWTVTGPGVVWNIGFRNGGVAASLDVFDAAADTVRGFSYIPHLPHVWSDPPPALIPEGEVYSTAGAVVARPLSAVEYLELVTIPQNFGPDTQLIGSQQLPDVAAAVAEAYGLGVVDAARSRIVFDNGGEALEAHVYAWVSYSTLQVPGLTTTNWGPELVYMVYAADGRLDAEQSLLNTLALSFIVNPDWLEVVATVERVRVEGEAKVQAELDRLIATMRETSDAIFDLTTEGFRERQEANDRIFQNMTETIRGTETYADPGVGSIELPGGFDEVWSTGTGDWILSNDPLFDPNLSSSVDWERIQPSP